MITNGPVATLIPIAGNTVSVAKSNDKEENNHDFF
jgi:hypothetical protein